MLTELNKKIQEFIDILGKQNQALNTLVGLQEEKRPIIILGKIEELNKLLQREGIIVSNLEKLEDARFKLHQELADKWAVPAKELPASMILTKLKDSLPEAALEMQAEVDLMEKNFVRLMASNKENNALINHSLDYIYEMQSRLTGDNGTGAYSAEGEQIDEKPSRPVKRLLDKKV